MDEALMRSVRLMARMRPAEAALVRRAARLELQRVSEFLRGAALEAARSAIAAHQGESHTEFRE